MPFYCFWTKNLKFASHQLDDGVGGIARFGTIRGGAAATRKKGNVQEVVTLDV